MQKQLERLNKAREEKERVKKMTTRGIPKTSNYQRRPLAASEIVETPADNPTEADAITEGTKSQSTFKSFHQKAAMNPLRSTAQSSAAVRGGS